MTNPTVQSPATDLARLLAEVKELLSRHPQGAAFTLLRTPADLPIRDDEMLVQTVDPESRTITLRPTSLADLQFDDTLHATQVVDPHDTAFTAHAQVRVHYPKHCFWDINNQEHAYRD